MYQKAPRIRSVSASASDIRSAQPGARPGYDALHRRSGGRIELDGRDVTEPPPEIAAVFHDYSRSLMPWYTVRRNIELPLKNTIRDAKERADRVEWSLREVGLG